MKCLQVRLFVNLTCLRGVDFSSERKSTLLLFPEANHTQIRLLCFRPLYSPCGKQVEKPGKVGPHHLLSDRLLVKEIQFLLARDASLGESLPRFEQERLDQLEEGSEILIH